MGGMVLPDGYSYVSNTIYRNTSDLKMGADIVKLTVVDSRGNTNSTNLKVNVVGEYFQAYINQAKAIRDDGNGMKVKIKATGKISEYELEQQEIPYITITYTAWKAFESEASSGIIPQSDITYNTSDGTFEVNSYIQGDLGAVGFTQNKEFTVDLSCSGIMFGGYPVPYNGILVDKGKILKDVCESGVAFGGLYDTNVGGALQINGKSLLDITYPIGSIYMSVISTNPATLLGGTWSQLKDRFLLGAGDTYSNGATG